MIDSRKKKDPEAERSKDAAAINKPVLVGFRPVYVFYVSRTEGAEHSQFTERTTGEVGEYRERLIDFTVTQGIELQFTETIAPSTPNISDAPKYGITTCAVRASKRPTTPTSLYADSPRLLPAPAPHLQTQLMLKESHHAKQQRISVPSHRYRPPVSLQSPPHLRRNQASAESIRQHGLIQPITVRPHKGGFEIVAVR